MVPSAGIPKSRSEIVHAVPAHPPIYAARAPYTAAAVPCALLVPNSITGRPAAARTILLAFVAIRLWWLTIKRIIVSTNCACITGPLTVRIGSPGKIGVPSGIAHTSHVNLNSERYFKKSSLNIFCFLRYSISSSVNSRFSRYSITCSRPAMIA